MIRANTLAELQAKTTASLDRLAGQVASGALSLPDFVEKANTTLEFAHSRASVLGAFRAKRHNPPTDVAIRVAAEASREQREFLFRFARELSEGKYRPKAQGGKGARQRLARFALYSARLSGTANEAWKETQIEMNAEVEGLWNLGRRDRHCPDCRRESSLGWRPLREFSFMPGQGRTACFLKCGCSVSTRAGAVSYDLT